MKKGGINAITHEYPNTASSYEFLQIPKTIHDCTAKNVNIITAATKSATRDLTDIPSRADTS
jgi:hypothetical protein